MLSSEAEDDPGVPIDAQGLDPLLFASSRKKPEICKVVTRVSVALLRSRIGVESG
jgi:hypothetical protein